MPSSSRSRACGLFVLLLAWGAVTWRAQAEQTPGFATERLYQSAPGGGWFVLDSLDMHGALAGTAALTLGFAQHPLTLTEGTQQLSAVTNQAFADFGFAAVHERWRFYLNLAMPLAIDGESGTLRGITFTGPEVNPSSQPDTINDARLGVDVRLLGEPGSRFRLGVGGQLFVPTGSRKDYESDNTWRGMLRALVAGDVGLFTYAGQMGVHIRPFYSPSTGGPLGSELLFGAAAGARLPVGASGHSAFVIGPEIFGGTAFRSFFTAAGTPLEALVSGRFERDSNDGPGLRVKLGLGAGLNRALGEPAWRIVLGLEVFGHAGEQ